MKSNSGSGSTHKINCTLAVYLDAAPRTNVVSARDAIAHIRTAIPEVQCSDGRLADIVAGAAIIAGLDVGWDPARGRALYVRARGFQAAC